ncbi:MAG: chemotaxis response regulator protein-glutamate methylesterase [Ignavibacteria bacterium]|nr:chemotaxis response regulator protein-glutamate methylesterase [Ignavibacteria bacterium]
MPQEKIIRVLVVDDSAYIRKVLTQILQRSPFIEVVGTASNGREALEKVEELNPDVITLDLIMPEMDGITFIEEQMKKKPIPIVVCSIASETGELAMKALDSGAVDFIQKPTALATEKIFEITEEITQKVKAASLIDLSKLLNQITKPEKKIEVEKITTTKEAVVIGVSTGGPQALRSIIPLLPSDFPIPVLIVLHMPEGYTKLFAEKLNELSNLNVIEAQGDELVKPGTVYLAKAGKHLLVERRSDGNVYTKTDSKPLDLPHRPSIDVLFSSAAEVYKEKLIGIVLTGMGDDGLKGCTEIKKNGGFVLTEAESTAIVYGMPKAVYDAGLSDMQVPLYELVQKLIEVVKNENSNSR